MKKLFGMIAVALLTFASCSNEDLSNEILNSKGTITATIEQEASKSRMVFDTDDNTLSWADGDAFSVLVSESKTYPYSFSSGNQFTSSNPVPENTKVAGVAYPYVEGTLVPVLSGQRVNMTLPSAYENVDGGKCALPMWGTWNDGHVSFKHMAGVLRVNLNKLPAGYNKMKVTSSNVIAGSFTADITKAEPVLSIEGSGSNTVTLSFTAVSEGADQVVYLPLPVGTYESIQVSILKDDSAEKVLANWTNKTVARATIYTANATYVAATSNSDVNTALGTVSGSNKNVHVVMTAAVSGTNNKYTVPEVSGSSVTLDFNSVADDADLTIMSGTGASTESQQNIAVNVKNSTAYADMVINTPKATVEVGSGKFATITATTATNTLIIKSGVTVTNLNIVGGNAIIEAGATVGSIINTGGGTVSYKVNNVDELEAAIAGNKPVIVLGADITSSEIIAINNSLTLNGDGYKITSTAKKAFELYADATFKNVTIEGANRCVDTRTNVALTLDNVSLIADNYNSFGNPQPLTIGGSTDGTTVTINNSTISAKDGYGIITFVKTKLVATGSTIGGYNALYVKEGSEESDFSFINCSLHGSTADNDVEGNSFSVIAIRTGNVTLVVDENSTITASGNFCHALSHDGSYPDEEGPYTGIRVKIMATVVGGLLDSSYYNDNTLSFDQKYANTLKEAGYIVSDPEDDLVTVVDVATAKIGNELYATLPLAITAVNNDETIVLNKNVTLTETVTIRVDKNFNLDLNGKTITIDAAGDQVIDFENYGTLNIYNGSITAANEEASRRCIYNYGTMTIGKKDVANSGVTFTQTYVLKGAAINNEGVMTIEDATVNSAFHGIWNSGNSSTLTIKKGNYISTSRLEKGDYAYVVWNSDGSKLVIDGGTFTGIHGVIATTEGADVDVNSGTFTATTRIGEETGTSYYALWAYNSKNDDKIEITLDNCTLDASGSTYKKAIVLSCKGATLSDYITYTKGANVTINATPEKEETTNSNGQ